MAWLKHLPSIEKIKRVVWDCDGSKTLGPNRFTFSFYKKTWSLLSSDIFAIVNSFFRYEKLSKGIRFSFVVSIPKKRSPIYFLEFRPTSLINELWQNCCLSILKYVFISVISVSQTGFTAWRHILDGFMIVNEVVSINKRDHVFFVQRRLPQGLRLGLVELLKWCYSPYGVWHSVEEFD